jgi:hypothetical protein
VNSKSRARDWHEASRADPEWATTTVIDRDEKVSVSIVDLRILTIPAEEARWNLAIEFSKIRVVIVNVLVFSLIFVLIFV